MKAFTGSYCAQGDLNIFTCDEIPAGLKELQPEGDGNHILAHSETGHHHVIDGNTVRVFEEDEFIAYLDVKEQSNVVHLRGYDTHETIALPPGLYRIPKQREYVAEGFRRAVD